MKLKWQIGAIALLSLGFPVLMGLILSSLNHSYQQNLLTAGQQQARVIVNSLEQFLTDSPNTFTGLIAQPLTASLQLNGLADDWSDYETYEPDPHLTFRLGRFQQTPYLWVSVKDSSQQPTTIDRLSIAFGDGENIRVKHINRQPEGTVHDSGIRPLKAYWHETADGYTVEIQLPDIRLTRLGIVATDSRDADDETHYGHYANNNIQLQPVFSQTGLWRTRLQQITPDNGRLQLTDPQNRLYYDINKIDPRQPDNDWLTNVLYPLIFAANNSNNSHNLDYQVVTEHFSGGQISLTRAHPPAHRNLIRTFIQTIGWLLGIALLWLLLFLIYAAFLAWRIRRLSRQLRHVLDDTGTIHKQLPSLKAGDEIGDLSRDLHQLLAQIDQYTDYLKQLGSRLSHEMKTPIGIIQSSLDNVSHQQLPAQQQDFIDRAAKANTRLKFILNQLSSLSRLQQAINDNERQLFDLNQLLSELIPAYQNGHKSIQYAGPEQAVMINGNPDLMAQLLDKIIDNAFDFSLPDQPVKVHLSISAHNQTYHLAISNQGPTIARDKLTTVFDSLHSYRNKNRTGSHLGIGLYVARLIARFHHADIRIANQYQPDGVVVSLSGPLENDTKTTA